MTRLNNHSALAQPSHSPVPALLRLASQPRPITAQLIMVRCGPAAFCPDSTRLAGSLEAIQALTTAHGSAPMVHSASLAASLFITPAWLILSLSLAASRSQFHVPMM